MDITSLFSADVQVHELWSPPMDKKIQETGLDILFVHGSLWNATARERGCTRTWMQRDNPDVCWPARWLPADLGFNVRILSVSYNDVGLREKDIPKQEIADVIAHELGQLLFPSWGIHGWELGRKRPVVLVGHEFGGDVIESLVMEAKGIVKNTRLPRSSTPYWGVMSSAEAFVRNVVQIVVYARQRVHDNWELNKDGSSDDSCSLFLCNPKSRFVEGIEPFSSWEEKAVWSLDSPGEHGNVWKPPNKRHESYSLLLESLLQARHEEHWKSPISMDVQVHELWSPPMDKKIQETGLDILFVHGSLWKDTASVRRLRGTWMQRDNPDVCWPARWLPADLGFNVRILSVSYNDVALREKDIPKQEIADVIAHELGQLLFPSWGVDGWELGRKGPVVLVGHEFGGDVIESLVMEAKGIVKNTRLPRSSTQYWGVMSSTEAFVRNVVQIVVYARQRVHDNSELNKDGSIDDSCSLFLCNPKSRFVEGIERFSSWEEKAVWSLDSPGEHGDVWKPPNKRHESYSLLLESLLQAQHEEHWKSPISTDVEVHELWSPPMDKKIQERGLDILFVHGSLGKDTASVRGWRGTWMQRDNPDVCWPEVWLPADLGFNVRILSVSYNDVGLREKDIPKQEIADVIAHELGQLLFPSWGVGGWELGRKRPVVLVGHEFGGDVIKSLVMEAKGIVQNTRLPRSSAPYWGVMSSAEAFVQNVVQIVVYARQRVHDNSELNKDGSIDDSCSLFLCNRNSEFFQGIERFSSWEEKAVWSLDSPGEHGDVWKPPNERHESYSLLLESLLQARHEEHWKSPISTDVEVHELWSPPMDKKIQETGLDILFVHGSLWKNTASVRGLRGTWMQRDNPDVCWPEVWLPADLGFNARILSVSYNDVGLREKDIPKQEIADVIAHELGLLLFPRWGVGRWGLGRKRPVVLVGHEFGGNVIKSLVMAAKEYVKCARLPRSSSPWGVMSSAEAFVRNVVQIVVYARQRVNDNSEQSKDGSIDDSCSLFLCNPKSEFFEGIEPFSSWEEKAVWSLDSPGEHGDVWKPPNERHESYSLLLESLLQARHEEHWKSPISADVEVDILWSPPMDKKIQETALDILFVHGSLWKDRGSVGGWRGTWTQRDNPDVCWPRDWLPADLGFDVGKFGVSYNDVGLWEKDIPKQEIADVIAHELGQHLFRSEGLFQWGLGRKRPVVLVGHEFGGDVIKSLVMEARGIVKNTRLPRSSTRYWGVMSSAEAFVRNVVQIVVYARQRVHDNSELNKDGSIDDSCSLFLCNPKSRFVEGVEPFSSWEEKAVWSLDSPGEHGDVWKPPNERHESYSLLLDSLLQARHEEHWKSPISADLDLLLNRFSDELDTISEIFDIEEHGHLPSLESVLQDSIRKIILTSKVQVPEQRIQFLFGNAKSMAKVVGVGVDFAIVYLSRENLITIEKINQLEWGKLWREALQDGSSFYEPILIRNIPPYPYFRHCVNLDGSCWTLLRVCAFFFMARNLLQLNAMAIHDCLQGGSSCLGMPSGKDKIVVKTETYELPSFKFLWDVLGCVAKHGVGCKRHHGEGDEDTIGDGGSATPGTNIVGPRVAQKHDHEDMPSASEGHHEGRESTRAEGERNYGHGDTPSEGGEGGGRNIAGEKDYHNQDDENVHKVGGKDGEGHAKSEKDPSTGILECSWMERFSFLNFKGGEGGHGGKESTSGGSGGGDAPGERGEGGSNPDGGDDDRSSHHDGPGNPSEGTLSETSVVVRVHPKYQPSNCRWEEKGEHIDPNDQDLKKVNITPRLELQFRKEGDSKLLTTKMSVSFDIAAAKPKPGDEDVNNNRFGWFQKCLSVSLQCLHENAAQLRHDVFPDTKDTTKTIKTNTTTTPGAWQRTANLSVTPPFVKAELTVGKPTTTTTTLQEDSMETPTEHIRGGFLAQDMSERGQRHRLSYNFVYQNPPKDIKDTQGDNRSMYLNTGMCHTVYSSIKGTWDDLDDEEASEYEFRAQREVCELTKDARSKKKSLMKKLLQIYEMKLYINQKMTHIEKLVDRTLTRRPDQCELVGVDTQPVIDSDGASSSAQQRI